MDEDFTQQRPQRTGYSDLNERQREGVPAIEADEAEGKPTELPDLGSSNVEPASNERNERSDVAREPAAGGEPPAADGSSGA